MKIKPIEYLKPGRAQFLQKIYFIAVQKGSKVGSVYFMIFMKIFIFLKTVENENYCNSLSIIANPMSAKVNCS